MNFTSSEDIEATINIMLKGRATSMCQISRTPELMLHGCAMSIKTAAALVLSMSTPNRHAQVYSRRAA